MNFDILSSFNECHEWKMKILAMETRDRPRTNKKNYRENNEAKKPWARRDSNTRSSPCEGDVIAN